MKAFIMQEEIDHLDSATAQCPPCIGMATYPDKNTYKYEECIAYAKTFACMEGLKAEASSWYKKTINAALNDIWDEMNNMGCTNLPQEPS